MPPSLVNIVIVNWNYGRFVAQAIASVRDQSYPNVSCIVVDNGSTDESRSEIERARDQYPALRVIHLRENFGHLGAIQAIQSEFSAADFVTFLDSDDLLFDDFVDAHVQAIQVSGAAISTNPVIDISASGEILSGAAPIKGDLCKPSNLVAEGIWRVPANHHGWCWSPSGSANMHRSRGIIAGLALLSKSPPKPFFADTWFNALSHAIGGTAIIERPLSMYRIHGNNDGASNVDMIGHRRLKRSSKERSKMQRAEMAAAILDKWPIPYVSDTSPLSVVNVVLRNPQEFLRDEAIRSAFARNGKRLSIDHREWSRKAQFDG